MLDKILEWAKQNSNVIAVIITGSRSREDSQIDEFSDYDIEFILKNPQELVSNNDWLSTFGKIVVYLSFNEGQDFPSRLVFYEGMIKVDFTLAGENRIKDMITNGLDDLYQRGYKVLLDKDNITARLPKSGSTSPVKLPTEEEFMETVSEFWFEAAHMPKYLLRDDLWVVKFRDWTMKEMILKMLEWNALCKNSNNDVYYLGTHMKKWVDNETWTELEQIFGYFDTKDCWRALLASLQLFRRLSKEVSIKLNINYPESMDKQISEYLLKYRNNSQLL